LDATHEDSIKSLPRLKTTPSLPVFASRGEVFIVATPELMRRLIEVSGEAVEELERRQSRKPDENLTKDLR
jgi:hypothetical protein